VFISSVNARISTPMTGAYNASKSAIEAMVDALRMEVRPWGVRAIIVEPAQTDTAMWQEMSDEFDGAHAALAPDQRELYARHFKGMRRIIPLNRRMAVSPDRVAATVEKALTASRPRARYVVGAGPRLQAALSALTPTPVLDAVLRTATGIPRKL
jgi:NAD(P)-dependent dehydrogenase (short-subunit alcohol dehydrogenase family)